MIEVNFNPNERQLRQFACLVLPLAGTLIAAVLQWKCNQSTVGVILFSGTMVVAVAGLVCPVLVRPIYVTWTVAAYPIGWVVSHLLIAVIFFLVVTPIGLLMRLIGRDALGRRFERDCESYWQPREDSDDSDRYFRQF